MIHPGKCPHLVGAVVFLGLFRCGFSLEHLSCSVTHLNVFIGPIVRSVDAVEKRLSSGRNIHHHDVHKDELGALANKEKEIDQGYFDMKIKPQRHGKRNSNYPPEGYFDINVQQSASLICYNGATMKEYDEMVVNLQEYFGSDSRVTQWALNLILKPQKRKGLTEP